MKFSSASVSRWILSLGLAVPATLFSAAHGDQAEQSPAPARERSAFLAPFLKTQSAQSSLPQGALQVELLPELLEALPRAGIFDLVQFPMPDGSSIDLWLSEFQVTTDSTTIVVMRPDKDGQPVADYTAVPQVRNFRGHVSGAADSLVFLSFGSSAVSGFISIGDRLLSISNGPRGELPVVISDLDSLPEGAINWYQYTCQVRDGGQAASGGGDGGIAALGSCKAIEIAVETDNEFRGLFSSDQGAVDYATQILAGMNTIYFNEMNLYPVLKFLRVWSQGTNDPWSANGSGAQLDQFVNSWGGGGGPPGSNPRDLAHLMSARDLGGGVAYLNAVCNPNIGFAVSGNLDGSFPYPLQDNSAQNWDIMVTTHEMGHNCGCNHTHDLGVDNCVGGGCISNGTIMSYCHLCPGGLANIRLNFADANIAQMDAFLPPLSCLSEPCPIFDPTSFSATDGSFVDTVRLTWNPPATPALRLEIERRRVQQPPIAFTPLASNVSTSDTLFNDFLATPGVVYEYRIRSIRADTQGPSDWVGPDSGFRGVLGPTALTATDGEFSDRVSLSWTAPVGYSPAAYAIYRGAPGVSPRQIAEIPATVTEYQDDGAYDAFAPPDSDEPPDGEPNWNDWGLGDAPNGEASPETLPGTFYTYDVRAKPTPTSQPSAPSADTGCRAWPGLYNLLASCGLNS